MAGRFASRPRRAVKRDLVWFTAVVGASSQAVGAASVVLTGTLNSAALALRPFTVMRTHLLLTAESDQIAATEDPFGSLGMIVVSEAAAAAGVASVPTPGTEPDASWIVWQGWQSSFVFLDATGTSSAAANQYEVDSKAMRKVGIDDQLIIVLENSHSTFGAEITYNGRVLVALH